MEHIYCPVCGEPYGFIKCRVTDSDGSNSCLQCFNKKRYPPVIPKPDATSGR